MKKIIILILISFFVFGCRTKRTIKNEVKEVVKEQTVSKTETVEKEDIKQSTIREIRTVQNEDKNEDKKEVEIVGKVDKENPITYYNIVNGDTIDLFKITGNADFIFKSSNNNQKSNINNNISTNTTRENKSEKSISNAVENVKVAVKEVQTKSVDIVKKDLTFGSYMVFFFWGVILIVILALIYYLRKSTWFNSIINKFK